MPQSIFFLKKKGALGKAFIFKKLTEHRQLVLFLKHSFYIFFFSFNKFFLDSADVRGSGDVMAFS